MATIKIYGMPPSTFTRTVLLAAEEKGIDYELVPTRPADMTPFNPFHKIPAMTHGDLTLFESIAILRYFERTFGGTRLWPDDSKAAALVDQWSSAVADSLVNAALRYMASRFGFLPIPAEMAQQCLDKTRAFLPHFDRQLGKTRFLAGAAFSAADLYLAPLLFYFPDIPELKAILDAAPNCRRWMAEMQSRASVVATEPTQKPRLAA
jgi:glutathione S-transferase